MYTESPQSTQEGLDGVEEQSEEKRQVTPGKEASNPFNLFINITNEKKKSKKKEKKPKESNKDKKSKSNKTKNKKKGRKKKMKQLEKVLVEKDNIIADREAKYQRQLRVLQASLAEEQAKSRFWKGEILRNGNEDQLAKLQFQEALATNSAVADFWKSQHHLSSDTNDIQAQLDAVLIAQKSQREYWQKLVDSAQD